MQIQGGTLVMTHCSRKLLLTLSSHNDNQFIVLKRNNKMGAIINVESFNMT